MDSIFVPLNRAVASKESTASRCQSKVCGDRIQGWDCGDGVAEWLCDVLSIPGVRLLRQSAEIGSERNSKASELNTPKTSWKPTTKDKQVKMT